MRPILPLTLPLILLTACATREAPPPTYARSTAPLPGLLEQTVRFASQTHDARLAALTGLLDELDVDYRIESFANPHPERDPRETGYNVIVELAGSSAASDRTIVVGAHYDAVRLPDGRFVDGMVDNAAGSVVLARLAKALSSEPLHHPLRLVFFDLEESGLLGSAQFAAGLDPATVAAMVNLDVQGYGDTVLFGPSSHTGNATVYAAMHGVCAAHQFDCMTFPSYPPSDDRSFQSAGIPNISIAVMPAVEGHQMWLMLNAGADSGLAEGFAPAIFHTIHSENDTAERLDPAGMTLGYDAVRALVLELDRVLD